MAVGDFYPDTCRTGGRVDDRIDKRDPARIGLAGKSLQGEMNLVASVQERQVNFESVEHRPYARQVRYVEQDSSGGDIIALVYAFGHDDSAYVRFDLDEWGNATGLFDRFYLGVRHFPETEFLAGCLDQGGLLHLNGFQQFLLGGEQFG